MTRGPAHPLGRPAKTPTHRPVAPCNTSPCPNRQKHHPITSHTSSNHHDRVCLKAFEHWHRDSQFMPTQHKEREDDDILPRAGRTLHPQQGLCPKKQSTTGRPLCTVVCRAACASVRKRNDHLGDVVVVTEGVLAVVVLAKQRHQQIEGLQRRAPVSRPHV